TANRLADDPEFTSRQSRRPLQRANPRSNWSAKRPVVSQKSSAESTRERISAASKTLPETGTLEDPGMNSRAGKAAVQYSPTRSRIRARRAAVAESVIAESVMRGTPDTR